MTVQELKAKKVQLEASIAAQLKQFSIETGGCMVSGLDLKIIDKTNALPPPKPADALVVGYFENL